MSNFFLRNENAGFPVFGRAAKKIDDVEKSSFLLDSDSSGLDHPRNHVWRRVRDVGWIYCIVNTQCNLEKIKKG